MEGRTHNLLNQSVAAGYRSRPGSNASASAGKDQEGGGSIGEKKRSKRPRPGGPPASPRGAPSATGGGGGSGAAAAAGLVVERPSARHDVLRLFRCTDTCFHLCQSLLVCSGSGVVVDA